VGEKALLIVFGTALLVAGFVAFAKLSSHQQRLNITVMFTNGDALRVGAPVRVSGIHVGTVRRIRIRSESRDHPVEVQMELRTPYELRIPRGAYIGLATAGVLGETFVDFDVRRATGPPIQNGDVLVIDFEPSDEFKPVEQLVERLKPMQESLKKAVDCPCPLKLEKPAGGSSTK